jgi:hypothetical protein
MVGKRILGVILIILGTLFTLDHLQMIRLSWNVLWPLFLLLPGIAFHAAFFGDRNNNNAGLLVPGGMLTCYGLLFLSTTIFGWQLLEVLWPIFILGVALGLFELYLFGPRQPGLLIPVAILTAVGGIFLAMNLLHMGGGLIIGLLLIIAGVFVVLKSGPGKIKTR